MLQVKGLSKRFGGFQAVKDVSLEVREGEIVGLIGPNGAGKTTLFNMISLFLAPDEGEVHSKGKTLTSMRSQEVAKLGILRTFQTPIGFPKMSCLDNLLVVPTHVGEGVFRPFLKAKETRLRDQQNYEKAVAILRQFGLYEMRNELVENLSAGQLKLLELGRQLMADPYLLMLDEPASGVNPAMLEKMIEHIQRLRSQGMTFLIIDHNLGFINRICDRIYVLAQGQLIAKGTPEEISNNKLVKAVYLGGDEHEAS